MDSSGDVSREDYTKEKDFVVTLAKYLHLSPNQTRAALLTYGYTATPIASYDSYDRLVVFENATKSAPYIAGKVSFISTQKKSQESDKHLKPKPGSYVA